MAYIVKQISSLEKVRIESNLDYHEIKSKTLLKGERFSDQIAYNINTCTTAKLSVESLKLMTDGTRGKSTQRTSLVRERRRRI